MNISSNIIRFPVPPASPVRHGHPEQEPAKIVGFPMPEKINELAAMEFQERGQVFAAHRIVARVADQLDAVAVL